MIAKQRLIEFLKSARVNPELPYTFTLDMPPPQARDYIHRMRVELARFRNALRDRGERIRPFKMLIEELIPDSLEPNRTHVTLRYQLDKGRTQMHRDISEVFDLVATGDKQLTPEVTNVKAS